MPRSISIVRRKPDLIDLTVRLRSGVDKFRFSVADNFDTALAAFQVVPQIGYVSRTAAINDIGYVGSPFRGYCRFLFAPSDYTVAVPAMRDDKPIYLSIEEGYPDGTFGSPEALHMVMPAHWTANRGIILSGTVPVGANLTNSLEIQLPMQCFNWEFTNIGSNNIYVAFERGATAGPEFVLGIATSNYSTESKFRTNISQVFLRADTNPTDITALLTARNES